MLIKSKTPRTLDVPLGVVSMEDIDHVIHTYELQGVVASVESLHDEIVHAGDIVSSVENLALVLEGIQEYSMTDTALVQVVGDVAGASCGIDGSHFTPSMEDQNEGKPLGEKIKAILNQIAAFLRKVYAQIKMYIAHQFSKSHRIAKSYESLGEKIKVYDFTRAEEIEMRDLQGAKGGLMGVARELAYFKEQVVRCSLNSMSILTQQVYLITAVTGSGLDKYPAQHAHLVQACATAAQGYTSMETAAAKQAVSKTMLGGGHVEVTMASEHAGTVSADSFKQAFDASVSVNQNRADASMPAMSKFKITHQLMKDIFDSMREVMDHLTNPDQGWIKTLKGVDEICVDMDQRLHKELANPSERMQQSEELMLFYRVAATNISHGQLKDMIHMHHYFQRVLQIVISYMESCLEKSMPKAEPAKPAQPGHQAAAAAV